MFKRSISYLVVSAVLLSSMIFGLDSSWASTNRADQSTSGSFLIWLNQPQIDTLGESPENYATAYHLKALAIQEEMIPFLLSLKNDGYIESFELLSPPNTIMVQSSRDVSLALSSLPHVMRVSDASSGHLQTAQASFSDGVSAYYPLAETPGLHDIVIHLTENYLVVNLASPGATATVQITNRALSPVTGIAGSSGYCSIGADFRPGDVVQVSALSQQRQVTIPPAFTINVDTNTDIVSGVGPAGATIQTELWREPFPSSNHFDAAINVTADGTGSYSASYATAGKNIERSDFVYAKYSPSASDTIAIVTHPFFLRVNESQNWGYGYVAPATVVNTILRNAQGGIKGTGSSTSSSGGLFWVQFGTDIAATDSIEVSGGGASFSLTIPEITAWISGPTGVSGTINPAAAGSPVTVEIVGQGFDDTRNISLNANGQFGVTFDAAHLSQMQYGMVFYFNPDGHQVFTWLANGASAPTPTPPIYVGPTPTPGGSPIVAPTIDPSWTNRLYLPLTFKTLPGGW